jgi:hypothetical protein
MYLELSAYGSSGMRVEAVYGIVFEFWVSGFGFRV